MDAIEALDDGAYAHFDLQAARFPEIVAFMRPAYYYSGTIGVLVLFAIVEIVFLALHKRRGAAVALVAFGSAFALVEGIHFAVPRPLPLNADQFLGSAQLCSYPSAAVFLFTLCMILFALALWDRMNGWLRGGYVAIAAALVGWVCMSGFYLALHYVTDVIGGLAGAALIGWIAGRWMSEPERQARGPENPTLGARALN